MIDVPEIPINLRLLNAERLGKLHKSKPRPKQFGRAIAVDRVEQDKFRAGLERDAKVALRNRDWRRLETLARMLSTFDPSHATAQNAQVEK